MTVLDLCNKIAKYLDRGDMIDIIEDILISAIKGLETRHNFRHMKVRYEKSLSGDDYIFDNPITNYKELIQCHIYDSNGTRFWPLKRVSQEYATNKYNDYTNCKGRPKYISEVSTVESSLSPDVVPTHRWLLRPTCDASYTLEFNAYQYTDTSLTTHWWTQQRWDIALYASLLEAEPYLKNPEMMLVWEKFLEKKVDDLIKAERQELYSGSFQNIISYQTDTEHFDVEYVG